MADNKDQRLTYPKRLKPFNHRGATYTKIYPLQNRLRSGYAVDTPGGDPGKKGANGRLINVLGDYVDFYIEEIEADFQMEGTTAQSQRLRQFFPHNFAQTTLTVRGRAPNSFQYNRLSAFVRASHQFAMRGREMPSYANTDVLRYIVHPKTGEQYVQPTMRLVIRNSDAGPYPYNGNPKTGTGSKTVKGKHQKWRLEGYIKKIPAGAQHHDPAPAFEFDFTISESEHHGNTGIWKDDAVFGSQLKSWTKVFRSQGKESFIKDPEKNNAMDTITEEDVWSDDYLGGPFADIW